MVSYSLHRSSTKELHHLVKVYWNVKHRPSLYVFELRFLLFKKHSLFPSSLNPSVLSCHTREEEDSSLAHCACAVALRSPLFELLLSLLHWTAHTSLLRLRILSLEETGLCIKKIFKNPFLTFSALINLLCLEISFFFCVPDGEAKVEQLCRINTVCNSAWQPTDEALKVCISLKTGQIRTRL